jgi:hypothetical protein
MISGNIQGLNTFTTGYLNTVNTNVAGWLSDLKSIQINSQPIVPVMVSYYTHDANKQPIYRPEGPQKYAITSMVAHSRVDTQRRRLGREGT